MALRILASQASMDSAMKLRTAIESLLGLPTKTILVSNDAGVANSHKVLLRYGCGYGTLSNEPEWGNKNFSNLCIDKLSFSKTFNGIIPVPVFINDSFPTEFPVLIRSTLTGAQSEGITVAHNQQQFMSAWRNDYFWTKYFSFDSELRVYAVFLDSQIHWRVYKKVPRDSVKTGDEFICGRNGEDNTKWILKDTSFYPKVKAILEKMRPKVLSMGGRFVGIDMIYVPTMSNYVTLELNSGPWLTLTTADWLAKIFVDDQKSLFR